MMRVVKIVLITVAAAILLVVAGSAVLLATMDDDDYRRLASYLVERATGRTLVVDGRFAVHLSLRPALVMSKARVTNPPWASGPNLAEIGHMEVQVALWPLLSRTLLIERLILEYATFALERSADGAANWTTGSGGRDLGLVPVLGTVRLRNVDWRYRDDAGGGETAVQLAHLTLEDAGGAGRLDAQGVWDGQPVAAKGTLGTLAEAVHPTSPFPLDLSASLCPASISACAAPSPSRRTGGGSICASSASPTTSRRFCSCSAGMACWRGRSMAKRRFAATSMRCRSPICASA